MPPVIWEASDVEHTSPMPQNSTVTIANAKATELAIDFADLDARRICKSNLVLVILIHLHCKRSETLLHHPFSPVVRSWQPTDLDSLVANANNRNIWINVRDRFPFPYTRAAGEDWLHTACSQSPETNFAIDVDGAAVGGIGFILQEDVGFRSAEIGYWLAKPFWGQGIMTSVVKEVCRHAFDNLELVKITAYVFSFNDASARVLTKCGFKQEGFCPKHFEKDGDYIDVKWFGLVKSGSE